MKCEFNQGVWILMILIKVLWWNISVF